MTSDGAGDGSLTPEQILQFQRDGYLLLPDFFSAKPLLARAREIISSFDPKDHPLTKFSTGGDDGADGNKHVGDDYFLESGDKLRFFLEEDAVKEGKLVKESHLAVNKCGHALHALDPVYKDFTLSPRLKNLARSLDYHSDPRVLQSMIICKQPTIGGAVPPHNDSTFLYTSPPSAIGFWFALEDCTTSNGCLSFLAGSHRWPAGQSAPEASAECERPRARPEDEKLGTQRGVNKRFVRRKAVDGGEGTTFIDLSKEEEQSWPEGDPNNRIAECKAGTLVLIHGSVMHKSSRNTSASSRFIYTFHMIEGDEQKGSKYDGKNWLQPTANLAFTKLYGDEPSK